MKKEIGSRKVKKSSIDKKKGRIKERDKVSIDGLSIKYLEKKVGLRGEKNQTFIKDRIKEVSNLVLMQKKGLKTEKNLERRVKNQILTKENIIKEREESRVNKRKLGLKSGKIYAVIKGSRIKKRWIIQY